MTLTVWTVGPLDWAQCELVFNCAVYKYSYLLTYLLNGLLWRRTISLRQRSMVVCLCA